MKKLLICLSIIGIVVATTGCNKQIVDLVFSYDEAIIKLPNGEIVQGKIESWTDYNDGDQLQIKIDGVYYLTDTRNATLIQTKE